MPVTEDIRNHAIIGPALRQGHKEGHKEGRHEALQEMLTRLLTRRFGPFPSWLQPRLSELTESQIEEISLSLLDATRLEDLFPTQRPKRNRK